MTSHGRKYGERDSYPIPVWNGIFDHYDRIGIALWTFAWLIDRIPKDGEQNGIGKVLGGRPLKIAEIVETMKGSTYRSIRRQLDKLEEQGYISRRRTPYGFVVEIRNSRKWGIWTARESGQKGQSLPVETGQNGQSGTERVAKKVTQSGQKGQNKENTAVHSSKETQQGARPGTSSLWNLIGVKSEELPKPFVELCEGLYLTRDGQPLGEFMGGCMDGWKGMGGRGYPREFAKAKAEIVAREREQGPTPTFLPEKPFQKRDWSIEELCPKEN